jgi:hypothetical protein
MKLATLVIGIAMAIGSVAAAQDASVQGGANSSTAVTANRSGASASQQGAVAANAASGNDGAAAQVAQGGELNATLSRPVDAGRAKPGDEVTATLSQHYESNGQVMLRRGTKLVGHVTEAQPRQRSAEAGGYAASRLGIVFDKAVLDDGREVPMNATIQAVAAGEALASSGARGFDGAAGAGATGAGAGRATAGGLGGVAGGIAGSARGALGGVGSVGDLRGATSSMAGGATHASAGALGGLNAAGRLMAGSRGAFGMRGIDFASTAAGSASGSVLTSSARDVELGRGTQMLLVSQASGSAAGAATIRR